MQLLARLVWFSALGLGTCVSGSRPRTHGSSSRPAGDKFKDVGALLLRAPGTQQVLQPTAVQDGMETVTVGEDPKTLLMDPESSYRFVSKNNSM